MRSPDFCHSGIRFPRKQVIRAARSEPPFPAHFVARSGVAGAVLSSVTSHVA
jgi:hypothetical protein